MSKLCFLRGTNWIFIYIYIYIYKVKSSRYRTGEPQGVCRGIGLPFHDRGTRRGWVVSSTARPHFTPWKHKVLILHKVGWAPGAVLTGGKSRPHRDFFYYQHSFILVHCLHSSTYVTDTDSIIPAVRLFIGQWTLSLPHITVLSDSPLSRTLYSYNSHTFPCPLISHCTIVQGWHTLQPMFNTEWHPFLHLMARERLCSFAFMPLRSTHHTYMGRLPFHSYHCQSTVTRGTPDAADPRCVPLVGSWS